MHFSTRVLALITLSGLATSLYVPLAEAEARSVVDASSSPDQDESGVLVEREPLPSRHHDGIMKTKITRDADPGIHLPRPDAKAGAEKRDAGEAAAKKKDQRGVRVKNQRDADPEALRPRPYHLPKADKRDADPGYPRVDRHTHVRNADPRVKIGRDADLEKTARGNLPGHHKRGSDDDAKKVKVQGEAAAKKKDQRDADPEAIHKDQRGVRVKNQRDADPKARIGRDADLEKKEASYHIPRPDKRNADPHIHGRDVEARKVPLRGPPALGEARRGVKGKILEEKTT